MFNKINQLEINQNRERPDIGHDLPIFARGRLTLESHEPDYMADLTNKTLLYFTPYIGCYEFAELALDISAYAASTMFDIFYSVDHTLSSLAWAGPLARATALVRSQGYLRLSTDLTKLFIGSIYVDAGQRLQDAAAFRYVGNYYNTIYKPLYVAESTGHAYNGVYRLWNNSVVNNQINFVICQPNGQSINTGHFAKIRAGADGSFAITRLYLDGVAAVNPTIEVQNYNIQFIKSSGGIFALQNTVTGFHYINLYERGDHASSTFDHMGINAGVMK